MTQPEQLRPEQQQQQGANNRLKAPPPPASYKCPLSGEVMEHPVMDLCAHNFEQRSICSWLEKHSYCPISRKPLASADLVPNHSLGEIIDQWKWRREHDQNNKGWVGDNIRYLNEEGGFCMRPDGVSLEDMEDGVIQGQHHGTRKHKMAMSYTELPASFMLLPQEREALAIVRSKAEADKLVSRRRRWCSIFTGVLVSIVLTALLFMTLKSLNQKNETEEG